MTYSTEWKVGPLDTVTDLLHRSAREKPDGDFIEFESGGPISYSEFEQLSGRMARGLYEAGIRAGDTVGVMLDTNIDCVLSWFAANRIGAIWVPFNTALKGDFLTHQVSNSGATIILAESDYAKRFENLQTELTELKCIYVRNAESSQKVKNYYTRPLSEIYVSGNSTIDHPNKPSDTSMLIYTSGTTGASKGCIISHNYCINMARLSRDSAGRGEDDINWSCLPMFHLNATTTTALAAMLTLGKCYFVSRFSLSGFWPSIKSSGATVVNILGQMIPLIAEREDCEASLDCFGQVRCVMAAPFDEHLQQIWTKRFGIANAGANCYGLTEASLLTSLNAGETAKPGSSGKRNQYFDVMIVDEDMREMPPGVSGEIVCRPKQPHIMFGGYWREPEKTLELMKDMWLRTGDIGKFDEDGFFYFLDRKKDYLRRGGENISSVELENIFQKHPDVIEVSIHAVHSKLSEDDVKATIILREGSTITEQTLCEWSIDQLPYYAIPRYIEFREILPINPLGKVMKYQLRDEGVTSNTWDRHNSDLTFEKR